MKVPRFFGFKKSCPLLLLFFVSFLANFPAISALRDGSNTALAEQDILKEAFPSICHFSGNFEQKRQSKGLPIPLNSSGNFYYSCDLGLIWNTESPINDVLLYVNATTNFRVNENGDIESLSGAVRYAMSRIVLRLMRGDIAYFASEFEVSRSEEEGSILLLPESTFMKKGIKSIQLNKTMENSSDTKLLITIRDLNEQNTSIEIKDIAEYRFEGERKAFEQCELLYPQPSLWCRVLRSPWRYENRR